jgi:hypothetical protein
MTGVLGLWEVARAIVQVGEGRLQVERGGIVDFSGDAAIAQMVAHQVAIRGANHILVVNVARALRLHRQGNFPLQAGLLKEALIAIRVAPAHLGELTAVFGFWVT